MPHFSPLTNRTVSTPNQSTRNGTSVDHIVLHHMASTGFAGVLKMWTTPTRKGSAHYAISNEGEIVGVVGEEHRAWSLGSTTDGGRGADFDRRAIVFEIENSAGAPGWPVSAEAHEATARVVADIASRYGIPLTRDRVIGHKEVYTRHKAGYATACPGGLDIDRIVARAIEIQGGAPAAAAVAPAARPAPPAIVVDGKFGPQTIRRLQQLLGQVQDGVFGPVTKRAFQRHLGQVQDGNFGPVSTKALQRRLGVVVDGKWGPQTTTALQRRLNAGSL